MKKNKVICIIVVIALILGIIVYKKFIEVPGNVAGELAIEELMKNLYFEEAEKYLEKIFVEDGNIDNPLPEFDDISKAPQNWIWNVVYKNLDNEENSYTYEQIQEKLVLLFSEKLNISFPEEGINNLIVKNATTGNYSKVENLNVKKEYKYCIKTSTQEDNIYKLYILEYVIQDDIENSTYILFDKSENEIKRYRYNNEIEKEEIQQEIKNDVVMQNLDLNEKQIKMEVENIDKINLISVHKEN